MAEYKCVKIDENTVWGILPCGEIKEFGSELEYRIAYRCEEDSIVDEMARLDAERLLDYPEDWVMTPGTNAWLAYA